MHVQIPSVERFSIFEMPSKPVGVLKGVFPDGTPGVRTASPPRCSFHRLIDCSGQWLLQLANTTVREEWSSQCICYRPADVVRCLTYALSDSYIDLCCIRISRRRGTLLVWLRWRGVKAPAPHCQSNLQILSNLRENFHQVQTSQPLTCDLD